MSLNNKDLINYYRFCPVSTVNGPGKRAVVWVQGCTFKCPGCYNGESWPFIEKNTAKPMELFLKVQSIHGIEGITFSGGEPLLQAGPLGKLAAHCQKEGLSVMCYTGFTWDELHVRLDDDFSCLLEQTDILITGRYKKELPPDRVWVGSSNQQIHSLTNRYNYLSDSLETNRKEFEVILGPDGKILVTGFIEEKAIAMFEKK